MCTRKLQTVYIGKERTEKVVELQKCGSFKAIKIRTDGKETIVPISKFDEGDKRIWIPEKGYVNLKGRKIYNVPVYDGDIDKFDQYLSAYGAECLFFSLNGERYDYTWHGIKIEREFNALLYYGAEAFNEFATLYNELVEAQRSVWENEYLPKLKEYYYWPTLSFNHENYIFKPKFKLEISYHTKPTLSMDFTGDRKKLETVYRKLRLVKLYETHPLAKEHRKAEEAWKKAGKPWRGEIEERCEVLSERMYEDVDPQLDKETEIHGKLSFSEVIEGLYGERVKSLYESILGLCSDTKAA